MKTFEEKVIETIMGRLDISKTDASSMAKGLISGKIPYIDTGSTRIQIK